MKLVKPVELKQLIPLAGYLSSMVRMDKNGCFTCLNPNHPDYHPSMCIDPKHPQYAHCFSCGASYDLFDCWAILNDGVTETRRNSAGKEKPVYQFTAVASEIANEYGYSLIGNPSSALTAEPEPDPGLIQEQHPRMKLYLEQRGITQETATRFNLSYSVNDNAIIFPYDDQGYYVERRLSPATKRDRYRFPTGQAFRPYNLPTLAKSKTIFVVEGQFDALSIMQESDAGAIATAANQITPVITAFKAYRKQNPGYDPTIIISMDNDTAGKKANRQLERELKKAGFTAYVNPVAGKYKDPNELLTSDREGFRRLLQHVIDQPDNWLDIYYQGITARHDHPDNILTGFSNLDTELDGGLQPKLYVLGAVSSLGKTTLALNIADNLAKTGRDVFFYSMESSKREITDKLLSRASKHWTQLEISRGDWLNTPEDKAEFDELFKAYARYQSRLHIIDDRVKASDVRDQVSAWRDSHLNAPTPLVVVDYLQILKAENEGATDKAKVTDSVSALSDLTKQVEVPVLVISSLNRASYWSPVSFESFKESGEIEYSADVVLGLEFAARDEYISTSKGGKTTINQEKFDKRKQENPRRVEMVVLKNRTGKTGGHIYFKFDAQHNAYRACTRLEALNPPDKPYHTKEVGKPVESAVLDYHVDPETGFIIEENSD